jgi:hypothetical protein
MGIIDNFPTEHNLDRVRACFARSYSHDIFDRNAEDLPVTYLSGSCDSLNGLHNLMQEAIFHHHRKFA